MHHFSTFNLSFSQEATENFKNEFKAALTEKFPHALPYEYYNGEDNEMVWLLNCQFFKLELRYPV